MGKIISVTYIATALTIEIMLLFSETNMEEKHFQKPWCWMGLGEIHLFFRYLTELNWAPPLKLMRRSVLMRIILRLFYERATLFFKIICVNFNILLKNSTVSSFSLVFSSICTQAIFLCKSSMNCSCTKRIFIAFFQQYLKVKLDVHFSLMYSW